MADRSTETIHATTVAIDGAAVLIEGPSGSGKSDLALRLIDRGAVLVSDDYTMVARDGDALTARAAPSIAGQMEVRGVGIVTLPYVAAAPVTLIVQLGADAPRMPERRVRSIEGLDVRLLALDAFHASAPLKVEMALRQPEATPP